MPLTSKQKHFIKKNFSRLSAEEIAKSLRVSPKEVEKFIAKKIGKNKINRPNSSNTDLYKQDISFDWRNFITDNINYFITLFILTLIAYFNSLDNALVSDDVPILTKMEDIKHASYIFYHGSIIGFVRRLFYFIFYFLNGSNPFLFHVLNLFFHLGATFISFILLSKIANRTMAILASCLFAVHPLMIESVSWISGGNYAEYSFFLLLSFFIYTVFDNKKGIFLALAAFFLALLSSEKAIVFPGILLAYELSQSRLEEMWKRLVPYFSLSAFWALLYISQIGQRVEALETVHYQQAGMTNPLLQIPIAIASYLKLIFWPSDLTLYHTEMSFSTGQYILALLVFLVYLGSIFYFYKKNKFLFFWLSFFIITLLPTLTPLGISWIVAERYAYLGALGIFAVIAYFFYYLLEKFNAQKNIIYASFAIIILVLSARTIARNMDWQNEDTLWIATAKTSPTGSNIHNNLGDVYARQGDLKKAAEEFKKATEINPGYADAYHNLANTYTQMKNFDAAISNYQKALEINPRLWQSHQQLAAIYFEKENYSAALDEIKKALEMSPADKNLQENLKVIESKL